MFTALLLSLALSTPTLATDSPWAGLDAYLRPVADSGCVNPGGTCYPGGLPCCGQNTACYRNRCVVVEDRATDLGTNTQCGTDLSI